MNYAEGMHHSPADTKDRLVRLGSKYQSSAPTVTAGDNVYLLVDSAGRLLIAGSVAHHAVDAGNPIKIGGIAVENFASESDVAVGDRVNAKFSRKGALIVSARSGTGDAVSGNIAFSNDADTAGPLIVGPMYEAPDGSYDKGRAAGDSGPGLGAANVAPIGGAIALRASAVAGEGSGTSTAVDNLGWVKSFHAVLDVTAVPSGGTPTLDIYIQTQLADGTWQDIAASQQFTTSAAKEITAWGPQDANFSGIGTDGAAITYDRAFTNEDTALASSRIRVLPLGDSMRVKWVFSAGGSTGDYTFSVDIGVHS